MGAVCVCLWKRGSNDGRSHLEGTKGKAGHSRGSAMKNLRLRAARAAKGLSQQALADLVGASRQTINAIEQGDYNPTINLCIAICRVLDRTLDDLFWDEEQADG